MVVARAGRRGTRDLVFHGDSCRLQEEKILEMDGRTAKRARLMPMNCTRKDG